MLLETRVEEGLEEEDVVRLGQVDAHLNHTHIGKTSDIEVPEGVIKTPTHRARPDGEEEDGGGRVVAERQERLLTLPKRSLVIALRRNNTVCGARE